MNSQAQRRRIEPAEGELVTFPRGWRKPLPAIIADAIANNRAVIARLKLGIHGPDAENLDRLEEVFSKVCRSTEQQISALEAFAAIDWR